MRRGALPFVGVAAEHEFEDRDEPELRRRFASGNFVIRANKLKLT